MVPCKYFQYLVVLFLVSEPYPTKGYNSFLNAGLYLSSCAHASGPGIGGWWISWSAHWPGWTHWVLAAHAERLCGASGIWKPKYCHADHALWCLVWNPNNMVHWIFLGLVSYDPFSNTHMYGYALQVMKDKHWVATICYFIGNVTWHHFCLIVGQAEIWSQQSQVLHMSSMDLWILPCKLQHNIFATPWLMARFQSPRTLGLFLGLDISITFVFGWWWPHANNPQPGLHHFAWLPTMATRKACEMNMYVMGFKGDWKYLYQLFSMTRNPYSEEAG